MNWSLVLVMQFVDIILYTLLAWYFDQVLPQEFGPSKHPLFFLSWRYWCNGWLLVKPTGQLSAPADRAAGEAGEAGEAGDSPEGPVSALARRYPYDPTSFEALTPQQAADGEVVVRGLRKVYNDGKVAIRALDVTLLKGQVTCLLGHNGSPLSCLFIFYMFLSLIVLPLLLLSSQGRANRLRSASSRASPRRRKASAASSGTRWRRSCRLFGESPASALSKMCCFPASLCESI